MVRKIKYDHNAIVTLAQDNTKEISRDEWNDGHDETGMDGFKSQTPTITILSGTLLATDTLTVAAAESGTADILNNIDTSNMNDNDEIKLFADTGDDITVTHEAGGAGQIHLLDKGDKDASDTVPIILIKRGDDLYEFGGGGGDTTVGIYGDGSDGDEVISVNTTLTSDKNYQNLTVNGGITLNTSGFIVRVFETLLNNGTITDDDSGGQTAGAAGITKNGFIAGGAGRNGTAGINGSGGLLGGAGGTFGKGGGIVIIFANILENNGSITANGENGTNGIIGQSGLTGGGGGGAGGSGGRHGIVNVTYSTLIAIGTITSFGGSSGNGAGGGANGSGGSGTGGKGGNGGDGFDDNNGIGGKGGIATASDGDSGTSGASGGAGGGGGAGGSGPNAGAGDGGDGTGNFDNVPVLRQT